VDARGELGGAGEAAAAAWYLVRGFEVLARNWRCRAGELDLVVSRRGLLVVCEVKTRRGTSFGGGYEAVGWEKQRKIRQLAELFLAAGRTWPDAVRFDVASVAVQRAGVSVEVFEDAF
jgi:putative endonuclease